MTTEKPVTSLLGRLELTPTVRAHLEQKLTDYVIERALIDGEIAHLKEALGRGEE